MPERRLSQTVCTHFVKQSTWQVALCMQLLIRRCSASLSRLVRHIAVINIQCMSVLGTVTMLTYKLASIRLAVGL